VADVRRDADRLISRCPVEIDHHAGTGQGETEDLSSSGLYVRTDLRLPIGEETDVRLSLPDGTIVALYARVAHVLTASAARALGRHVGMGLALIGPDTPARQKLCEHIDSLRSEVRHPTMSTTTAVIVVEPSAPLRLRMQRCLEAAGFAVTAVASATEALDAATAARPQAMIAASAMPVMTGLELAYAMSEHSLLSEVPVILIGDDGDLARLEAFRAGIRDHVPVPFLDEELVIRVHRVASPAQVTSPGLRGSLVDIGLGTLLSLLEFERKSGVLLVLRTGALARVFVAGGKILRVEMTAGDANPKDRLMRLLDWNDGQFEFSPAEIAGRDELGVSVTQALLEHARVRDEERGSLRR
jgi:CheY-like chemotaxis protein